MLAHVFKDISINLSMTAFADPGLYGGDSVYELFNYVKLISNDFSFKASGFKGPFLI